jgi:hypothetical protein
MSLGQEDAMWGEDILEPEPGDRDICGKKVVIGSTDRSAEGCHRGLDVPLAMLMSFFDLNWLLTVLKKKRNGTKPVSRFACYRCPLGHVSGELFTSIIAAYLHPYSYAPYGLGNL